jgi:HlyD family secretion protein
MKPNVRCWAITLTLSLGACGQSDSDRYQGYVEGEPVRVAAAIGGQLDHLSVQRGDEVKTGAALFALDAQAEIAALQEAQSRLAAAQAGLADLNKGQRDEELAITRAQLVQARAQAELSAAQLERQRELFKTRAVSEDQLDQTASQNRRDRARVAELEAALKASGLAARSDALKAAADEVRAAEAVVAQAQWRLDQKTRTASADGRVEDTYFRTGEWVPAGTPVLSLLPPQNRKLRFFVPESRLGAVHAGQSVRVHCDGCGDAIAGAVSFIATQAEYTPPVIYSESRREQLVFMIEAQPAPADALKLHPGQPVEVELLP